MKPQVDRTLPSEFGSGVRREDDEAALSPMRPGVGKIDEKTIDGGTFDEVGFAVRSAPRKLHADWRMLLAIAIGGGLVAFGFVGTFDQSAAEVQPRPSPDAPRGRVAASVQPSVSDPARLILTTPASGSSIDGATVEVRGSASGALGHVEFSVVLGGATLGSTSIEVPSAGAIAASIPVFVPPVTLGVELTAAWATDDPPNGHTLSASINLQRPFNLAAQPIGIWSSYLARFRGRPVVIIAGCAPLDDRQLTLRMVDAGGTVLATSQAAVGSDARRSGSAGGLALGLGSFVARLGLAQPLPAGTYRLEIDWRSTHGSEWGTWVYRISSRDLDRR
jgi:hypothetical protein